MFSRDHHPLKSPGGLRLRSNCPERGEETCPEGECSLPRRLHAFLEMKGMGQSQQLQGKSCSRSQVLAGPTRSSHSSHYVLVPNSVAFPYLACLYVNSQPWNIRLTTPVCTTQPVETALIQDLLITGPLSVLCHCTSGRLPLRLEKLWVLNSQLARTAGHSALHW